MKDATMRGKATKVEFLAWRKVNQLIFRQAQDERIFFLCGRLNPDNPLDMIRAMTTHPPL